MNVMIEVLDGVELSAGVYEAIEERVNGGEWYGTTEAIYWSVDKREGDSAHVVLFTQRKEQYRWQEAKAKEFMAREHGVVECWTTDEVQVKFDILAFSAPFCYAIEKQIGQRGSLMFGNIPPYGARLYYGWRER